jgi:dihydrofolate synthase/folylpolyglutamate synthase
MSLSALSYPTTINSSPVAPDSSSLEDWLSYLERLHPSSIDLGLDRVASVRDRLGLAPKFPVITVGGTNGKGSTCAMLESCLRLAGYKSGCYMSPHLLRYNERVRIGGVEAGDGALVEAFRRVEQARANTSLTYFEFGTLAAVLLFVEARIDVAVLEVGLGGRLDAVNAFEPDCAVVVSVALDHVDYLGSTRERIGFEKAGIFRTHKPAIVAEADPPASLLQHAQNTGADLRLIDRDFGYATEEVQWRFWDWRGKRDGLPLPALRGTYQLANASAALAALDSLREQLPVDNGAIRRGLVEVDLPARFQVLPGRPALILDVAHNPHAAARLAENLVRLDGRGRILAVFAMLKDKDINGVVAAVSAQVREWFVAPLPGPRGADLDRMTGALREARAAGSVTSCSDVATALRRARGLAGPDDKIVVFGSFHTVAAALRAMNQN